MSELNTPSKLNIKDIESLNSTKIQCTYKIKPGDTYWQISQKYKIPYKALMAANPNIRGDKLLEAGSIKIPKKKVPTKSLKDVYNKNASEKLADIAQNMTQGRRASIASCAEYVSNSLEKAGYKINREDAHNLEWLYDSQKEFEKIKVERKDLKNLPKGCIVVWQPGDGFGNAFKKYGHVCITLGNGKAASDYLQDMKDYGTDYAVYVPIR